MTSDELETLLRAWGRVCGERPPRDDDDSRPTPAVHALARGMQFAPGKRQVVLRQRSAMNRAGQGRRVAMAVAAGGEAVGLRIVGATYCDPITCTETRSGRDEARDWPVPPEISRVERAALDLQAFNDFRGRCLRVNYCTQGTREDKVLRLGCDLRCDGLLGHDEDVKIKRFKDELSYARVWIHARLAA